MIINYQIIINLVAEMLGLSFPIAIILFLAGRLSGIFLGFIGGKEARL